MTIDIVRPHRKIKTGTRQGYIEYEGSDAWTVVVIDGGVVVYELPTNSKEKAEKFSTVIENYIRTKWPVVNWVGFNPYQ